MKRSHFPRRWAKESLSVLHLGHSMVCRASILSRYRRGGTRLGNRSDRFRAGLCFAGCHTPPFARGPSKSSGTLRVSAYAPPRSRSPEHYRLRSASLCELLFSRSPFRHGPISVRLTVQVRSWIHSCSAGFPLLAVANRMYTVDANGIRLG